MREHGNGALDWAVPGYLFPIVSPGLTMNRCPPLQLGTILVMSRLAASCLEIQRKLLFQRRDVQ